MAVSGQQVEGTGGVVVAESERVAGAGARILEEGGNAFDAAAAASLACSMVHPDKCGIGGYLMTAVVVDGSTGKVWSLDSNSVAPAAAHESLYKTRPAGPDAKGLNALEYDCLVDDDANVYGPLAVGVPGQLGGLGMLHERWGGQVSWAQVVQPSLDLLDEGIPFGTVHNSVRSLEAQIRRFDATAQHLLPGGAIPDPDSIWHRPDMERTLQRLAEAGWRDFYEGELGHAIADAVSDAGGILTRKDMADFEPRVGDPLTARYRDAELFGAVLPNGPLSVLQALNVLDRFDTVPSTDVAWWHRMTEVLKRVWRDRLTYLADPDFADVPTERLLSAEHADKIAADIARDPDAVDTTPFGAGGGVPETSHVSTADGQGNIVSATITHGAGFGSLFTVPGYGLILGHGMCRMDPRPGLPNSVAGGKRPLNNVMTMVLRTDERDIALGMPGGRRIISVAPQMVLRLLDEGATHAAAALAPRMHVTGAEPMELQDSAPQGIADGLAALGHTVTRLSKVGGNAAGAQYSRVTERVSGGGAGAACSQS